MHRRSIISSQPTLRNIYKALASQYDPLGYLAPFSFKDSGSGLMEAGKRVG